MDPQWLNWYFRSDSGYGSTDESKRYFVMAYPIGGAHTKNYPCIFM